MGETQRLKIEEIKEEMVLAESVYSAAGEGRMMIARKDTTVDARTLEQLARYDIPWVEVYIQREPGTGTRILGSSAVKRYHEDEPPENPAPVIRMDLRTEAIKAIRELFAALQKPGEDVNLMTTYEGVKQFDGVLGKLIADSGSGVGKYVHIHETDKIDDYPYLHSLSVAMLSVSTGSALGFDIRQLLKLARCAILHDIGKPRVPYNIMSKKGKLTEEEHTVMREHSMNGALNLKTKGFGDSELWNGIMFHHEKVDGSGYPKGLTKDEIPIFSKIIAVADMYDAVTSARPHRDPITPAEAFELISSEVGKSFDYDIVKAFTKNLQLYPMGTTVELSDNRRAVVVNNDNVLRPSVRVAYTGELIDLSESSNLNLAIVKVV
ncbi:MAG: HD-GYP domain-containing protein [Defluviitaleaceae bacterium]|nr:HD-GYP domain-containing protein [Defluviitaleaceae bacterium]